MEEELDLFCVMFQTTKTRISDQKFCGVIWWHNKRKNLLRNEASLIDFLTKNTHEVCSQEEAGEW